MNKRALIGIKGDHPAPSLMAFAGTLCRWFHWDPFLVQGLLYDELAQIFYPAVREWSVDQTQIEQKLQTEAQAKLQELQKKYFADFPNAAALVELTQKEELFLRLLKEESQAAVILGQTSSPWLERFFAGSFAYKLLAQKLKPVALHKKEFTTPRKGPRNLAFLLSMSETDELLLEYARPLKDQALHFFHVVEPLPAANSSTAASDQFYSLESIIADNRASCEKSFAHIRKEFPEASFEIKTDQRFRPWDVILEWESQHHIDCLFVGTQGKRGLAKFFLGSVAQSLIQRSESSLFIIPTP